MTVKRFRRGYERLLEWICMVLMITLAVEVTAGVVFRYTGHSLVWYDEVATVLLAWITYYGSALAVLKHAHMGVPELVKMMPTGPRVAVTIFAQLCTAAFLVLLAWAGYSVIEILSTDNLVSLPRFTSAHTNSVMPIAAVMMLIGQALVFPEVFAQAVRGHVTSGEEVI